MTWHVGIYFGLQATPYEPLQGVDMLTEPLAAIALRAANPKP